MTSPLTFTIPGRVMGKLRWGSKPKPWTEQAKRYIDECNRIRALAWEGRAMTDKQAKALMMIAGMFAIAIGTALTWESVSHLCATGRTVTGLIIFFGITALFAIIPPPGQ